MQCIFIRIPIVFWGEECVKMILMWRIDTLKLLKNFLKEKPYFPGGSEGKEPTCNVGDLGLISGLERSPGEQKGYPLQYSVLDNFMGSIALRIFSIILLACKISAIVWQFEHYSAFSFFGTGMKTDLLQSNGHCWVFQFADILNAAL